MCISTTCIHVCIEAENEMKKVCEFFKVKRGMLELWFILLSVDLELNL